MSAEEPTALAAIDPTKRDVGEKKHKAVAGP